MLLAPLLSLSSYLFVRFGQGGARLAGLTALFTSTSSCGDPASISSHIYNPYRLQIVKSCITASGTVDRVIEEADGDVHLRTNLDPAYSNLTNSAIRGMMIRMLVEEDCESYEEFRRNILTHPPLQENWAGQRTLSGYIRNGLDANLVNA